jgi:transcriptional regulator with XRE-family HTH domain
MATTARSALFGRRSRRFQDALSVDRSRRTGRRREIVGEAQQVRLSLMAATTRGRDRPTDEVREAIRLSSTMADTLGRDVRRARREHRLTQAQLARRVGLHQTQISRIELGHGEHAPLSTWVSIGVVLGRPLAASFSRPLGHSREPVDAGHLAMQEYLVRRAREFGRTATVEVPTRPSVAADVVDVLLVDRMNRVMILVEAWNTFGDLGAAIRTTRRKAADLADRGASQDRGGPYRVAAVWVVRDSATNRSLVARYPGILRSAFVGSSRHWVRALDDAARAPDDAGLIWFDGAGVSLRQWRAREARPARDVENRRSAPSIR